MSRCPLEATGRRQGELYIHACPRCGRVVAARSSDPARVRQMCERAGPDLLTRAGNLAGSVIRGVAARAFQVEQATVAARLALCEACPTHYDPSRKICTHPACGCRLRKDGLLNKLAWSHEACPVGRWQAVESKLNSEGAPE